jgi:hypothetical protein
MPTLGVPASTRFTLLRGATRPLVHTAHAIKDRPSLILQGEVPQVLVSLSSIKPLVQYYWLYRIHPQINPAYKLNPTLQVVPIVIAFKQCAIQSGYKTG